MGYPVKTSCAQRRCTEIRAAVLGKSIEATIELVRAVLAWPDGPKFLIAGTNGLVGRACVSTRLAL